MVNYSLAFDLINNMVDQGVVPVQGTPFSSQQDIEQFYEYNLFKKLEVEDESLRAQALNAFRENNVRCKTINENFLSYFDNRSLNDFLVVWKKNVSSFLQTAYVKYDDPASLTSGATSSTPRGANVAHRIQKAECSSLLRSSPLWEKLFFSRGVEYLDHRHGISHESVCDIATDVKFLNVSEKDFLLMRVVPKTASSVRLVWPEPAVNAYCNRLLGISLSRCINSTHLHLASAAKEHRSIAKESSIDGKFATCDFSSASDLIALKLSEWLAPPLVAQFLRFSRLGNYKVSDDAPVETIECTATMGCGFCWEWETVVFYTFLQSIRDLHFDYEQIPNLSLRAFGDDLIYPSEMHQHVLKYASVFGWIVNKDKSFASGPFRESCGGDYHNGLNVRPVFSKNLLGTTVERMRLYNRIVEDHGEEPKSSFLRSLLIKLVDYTPENQRLFGPSHYGDAVFHSSHISKYALFGKNKTRIAVWKEKNITFSHLLATKPSPDVIYTAAVTFKAIGGGMLRIGDQHMWGYPFVPTGKEVVYSKEKVPFFYTSNEVDEMDPLSIFRVLWKTKAPLHMCVREDLVTVYTWRLKYSLAIKIAVVSQVRRIIEQSQIIERKSEFFDMLSKFEIDV